MMSMISTLKSLHKEHLVGKKVVNVMGDGNCLYRAVSRIQFNNEDSWFVLKAAGAQYALCNPGLLDVVGESKYNHIV
jgi:hypothetical protein